MHGSPPRPTKHLRARMSQRGIPGELTHFVGQFGHYDQDKLILNRKDCQRLLDGLRGLERVVLKVLDKGGIAVVEDDGVLITTYNLEDG